ncbi:MAG: hypothetical protein P4L85_04105 [Paludisphaera borealis]|uniref:hypothetical protein n=1 Tax=Paludisphaera borealis TaxID=1387353 RepID=UPI0028424726|nr:hypothetical protein [Paludisphaera borealis]MDR3618511.1 hypothetical protein [Paludisphaera borealis]
MQFTRIGDLDVVTRVSGPHHHFLGVALSSGGEAPTPVLERVAFENSEVTIEPSDDRIDLRREVLEAVSEANRRLGTNFRVMRIRYCGDDASVPGIYGRLARSLVEHVAREQDESGAKTPRSDGSLIEINS